jgi:pterin-4a-carbinolamine dehydratase
MANFRGLTVTLLEEDLLAALKELQEASLAMTSGKLPSAQEMERYHQAIAWSKRVIEIAEKTK